MYRDDLPQTIALFPLPGALLLPRSRLPLHIFEPRYLAMLDDALKTPHRLIGMIQPRSGPGPDGGTALHAVGCAGRVTAFSETEEGRYLISLSGVSRFHVRRELAGFSPYLRAEVDWSGFAKDRAAAETDPGLARPEFLAQLSRYFAARGLSADWAGLSEAEDEMLINALAMLCPFEVEDKQALLEAPHLRDRRQMLATLIEYGLRSDGTAEVVQ